MTILYESRRTAVGMAAQVAQGNLREFDLLFKSYVDDACNSSCERYALIALASSAVSLAVFASGNDPVFFTRMAEGMLAHGE